MNIQHAASYEHLSEQCANLMLRHFTNKPDLVLCLASGYSPRLAYQRFVQLAQEQRCDVSRAIFVKLDEWAGLPMDDPSTCEAFLQREILGPLGIAACQVISFRSDAPDFAVECTRLSDELARRGPLDLAILGLGKNGHLGLNEPADALHPHTHVATLADTTRAHAMLQSAQRPVAQGMTLGIGDLLAARTVILLVTGAGKRQAFDALQKGMVSTACPATFLHLHPNVICIVDDQALG